MTEKLEDISIMDAMSFFKSEITQFNTMLNGSLNEDYRSYIISKITIYTFAIEGIEELIKREKNERRI